MSVPGAYIHRNVGPQGLHSHVNPPVFHAKSREITRHHGHPVKAYWWQPYVSGMSGTPEVANGRQHVAYIALSNT